MHGKHLGVAAAACCGVLLAGSTARAEFNQRLTFDNTASAPNSGGLSGGVENRNLLLDDTTDAENEQIWRRGWGGGWGWGGRGWGGGWGWRGGWVGGWRGGWNTGWRGGWGWNNWGWRGGWGWNNSWAWRGGWGGWNGGWGWGAPVTTFYYSPPLYYYYPSVYYYPSYSWCPITLDQTNAGFNSTLQFEPRQQQNVAPPAANQPQQQPNGNSSGYGTYPYNGGPSNPVPMPQGAQQYQPQQRPAPATQPAPQKTVPLEGIPISLPGRTPTAQKYTYPAYGETPGRTQFAEDRPIVIRR